MNLDAGLQIFIALCAGIGALKVIINSVKNCVKQEISVIAPRLAQLEKGSEKDALILTELNNKVFSKETIQDMIDKSILQHHKECPKK